MLCDVRTGALLFLLSAAGCGAEPYRASPVSPGTNDAAILSGSGGALGSAGSGGTADSGIETGSGGAGGSPAPDAGSGGAAGVVDAADMRMTPEARPADAAPAAPFECNQILGLFVSGQWWPTFEAALDSAHWQIISQSGAYIELWADPNYQYWTKPVTSPCATRAQNPDRVVLIVYSTTLRTLADFRTNIGRAIATVQMKYPGVKRIELITTVRGPNNQLCPGAHAGTVVPPNVDQAIQEAAAGSMGLVTAGPKIEVGDCSWWQPSLTDLSPAGAVGVGQAYAAYYRAHL